ncbi:MAG: hypothetical protein FJ291_16805 [Planctomycetes bacterium]|nr:hypothetical protein [Planctomycetota bacterium]
MSEIRNPKSEIRNRAEAITILTYHALVSRPDELALWPPGARLYVLTLDEFRSHLDILASEGFSTISMADFLRWHQGALELPERSIVLSFDDGHRSNFALALPALRERGHRAVFFVTASRIGDDCGLRIADCGFQSSIRNPKSEIRNEERWLTWTDLRAMLAAGMEIGSHSLTHRPPSSLSRDELRRELAESKCVLEEGLGRAVDFVSSPTGYDSRHFAPLAREVGYKAAIQGVIGRNRRSTDPFRLRRILLKRSYDLGLFRRLVDPSSRACRRLRLKQALRNAVRRVLGTRAYEAIRRKFLAAEAGSSKLQEPSSKQAPNPKHQTCEGPGEGPAPPLRG